jgi:hypothetical protein
VLWLVAARAKREAVDLSDSGGAESKPCAADRPRASEAGLFAEQSLGRRPNLRTVSGTLRDACQLAVWHGPQHPLEVRPCDAWVGEQRALHFGLG